MTTEKRLIDANALMDVIRKHEYPVAARLGSIDNGMFTVGIQQAVDEQPTVDAVEVVRCGKCVHSVTDEENPGMCKCVESAEYESESGLWLGFVEYHTPDFFCAFGERKDNG